MGDPKALARVSNLKAGTLACNCAASPPTMPTCRADGRPTVGDPGQGRGGGLRAEFLPGRIRFLKPGQKHVGPNERPPFGCALLIWEPGGQAT